jgi:phosphohistidine phosphatase
VQVFLIRHADAQAEARVLTARGRDQARALGDRLRWYDCEPTRILVSPHARAQETAELIAAAVHAKVAVEVDALLAPDGDPAAIAAALRALPDDAVVVVVGHEPQLSALALLIGEHGEWLALREAEAARFVERRLKWRFGWDDDAPARP